MAMNLSDKPQQSESAEAIFGGLKAFAEQSLAEKGRIEIGIKDIARND